MAQSPIIKTLDTLMADLKQATQTLRETEKHAAGLIAAIKSLAGVCEDEEIKTSYLLALEEISGKPGFADAIRSVLREHAHGRNPLTPTDIKTWIGVGKKMDLSGYSNVMASIHTTLRRLKDSGEVVEVPNEKGERAYCWKVSEAERVMREAVGRKPRAPIPPKKNPAFYGDK
jgi:hypothetical protein